MFLYDLEHIPGRSLYERLTNCIRQDILTGSLPAGTRLPSKRRAAADLGISVVTVMGAYEQLLAEGYLVSRERSGYFVAQIDVPAAAAKRETNTAQTVPRPAAETRLDSGTIDLVHHHTAPDLFPLSIWNRLSRRVFSEQGDHILARVPYHGARVLREAIADILYASRGITADPEQILVSSGNQTLYGSLLLLLGRDRTFGVENPGYPLVARLYAQHGATVAHLPMDDMGVIPETLEASGTSVLHISPSHHFPTGLVTPITRRQDLLRWANAGGDCDLDRYILEDDYDSEFRLGGRPIPSLAQLDAAGQVIYMNTFTKTIAPSLRIGYAVLPPVLAERYREEFSYLACPVPSYEQYTLAVFIREGYFERHINRMRTHYRALRDALIGALAKSPRADRYQVTRADSGLHFLLHVDTPLNDRDLCQAALDMGIRVQTVRDFYRCDGPSTQQPPPPAHTLVVNYTGLRDEQIGKLVARLDKIP